MLQDTKAGGGTAPVQRRADHREAILEGHDLPTYLGLRYHRNSRLDEEATEHFREALRRDPEFAQAYHWLGRIALSRGELDAAETLFERYAALAPEEPRPHDCLGLLRLEQRRSEGAGRRDVLPEPEQAQSDSR